MTRRPVLAPGLRPLRHPSGQLVFGLDQRVRVPLSADDDAVRRALAILDRGESVPDRPELRRVRSHLAPVLRDGDALVRPGLDPGEVSAVTLRHPRTGSARVRSRECARVRVDGALGADVGPLLAGVGLGRCAPGERPTAVLVLGRGEPDRAPLDDLVEAGVPHLLVRAVETAVLLGPFVLPGRTACVRCGDLHRSAADPAYGALLTASLRTVRHDGVPEPADLALTWVALGWAVADLLRYAEGDPPVLGSGTVRLTPGAPEYAVRPLPMHPDCRCAWVSGPDPRDGQGQWRHG